METKYLSSLCQAVYSCWAIVLILCQHDGINNHVDPVTDDVTMAKERRNDYETNKAMNDDEQDDVVLYS